VAEQQAVKRKQIEHEMDDSEDVPAFTGREAGIEHIQSWADIAQEVLQAGDDIEAMPLDDVEYHVSRPESMTERYIMARILTRRFVANFIRSTSSIKRLTPLCNTRRPLNASWTESLLLSLKMFEIETKLVLPRRRETLITRIERQAVRLPLLALCKASNQLSRLGPQAGSRY